MTTSGVGQSLRWEVGSSSVELAVLFPVILLLVVGVIQVGMMGYAKHVVDTAAREAVAAAQPETATATDGETAAWVYLDSAAGLITDITVEVAKGEQVTATVTARAFRLVPGLDWELVATASGPGREFIPEPERT